eukprot:TRINITY_DN8094_c0_g1_i2.p1 TRINITY_DN8094_c0_g1~~TRINITY_DN8094_c0_g1_i2.p1  ORF type:complete len:996 (+),score=172.58 TRINITY_DN8094_c0_g1_i2:108-2990(+)
MHPATTAFRDKTVAMLIIELTDRSGPLGPFVLRNIVDKEQEWDDVKYAACSLLEHLDEQQRVHIATEMLRNSNLSCGFGALILDYMCKQQSLQLEHVVHTNWLQHAQTTGVLTIRHPEHRRRLPAVLAESMHAHEYSAWLTSNKITNIDVWQYCMLSIDPSVSRSQLKRLGVKPPSSTLPPSYPPYLVPLLQASEISVISASQDATVTAEPATSDALSTSNTGKLEGTGLWWQRYRAQLLANEIYHRRANDPSALSHLYQLCHSTPRLSLGCLAFTSALLQLDLRPAAIGHTLKLIVELALESLCQAAARHHLDELSKEPEMIGLVLHVLPVEDQTALWARDIFSSRVLDAELVRKMERGCQVVALQKLLMLVKLDHYAVDEVLPVVHWGLAQDNLLQASRLACMQSIVVLCQTGQLEPVSALNQLERMPVPDQSRFAVEQLYLTACIGHDRLDFQETPSLIEDLIELDEHIERRRALSTLWRTWNQSDDPALQLAALQGLKNYHPAGLVPVMLEPEPAADADEDTGMIATYRSLNTDDVDLMLRRSEQFVSIAKELCQPGSVLARSVRYDYATIPRSTLVKWKKAPPGLHPFRLHQAGSLGPVQRGAYAFALLDDLPAMFAQQQASAAAALEECAVHASFPTLSLIGAALGQQRWNRLLQVAGDDVLKIWKVKQLRDVLTLAQLSETTKLHVLCWCCAMGMVQPTDALAWLANEIDPSHKLPIAKDGLKMPSIKRRTVLRYLLIYSLASVLALPAAAAVCAEWSNCQTTGNLRLAIAIANRQRPPLEVLEACELKPWDIALVQARVASSAIAPSGPFPPPADAMTAIAYALAPIGVYVADTSGWSPMLAELYGRVRYQQPMPLPNADDTVLLAVGGRAPHPDLSASPSEGLYEGIAQAIADLTTEYPPSCKLATLLTCYSTCATCPPQLSMCKAQDALEVSKKNTQDDVWRAVLQSFNS